MPAKTIGQISGGDAILLQVDRDGRNDRAGKGSAAHLRVAAADLDGCLNTAHLSEDLHGALMQGFDRGIHHGDDGQLICVAGEVEIDGCLKGGEDQLVTAKGGGRTVLS